MSARISDRTAKRRLLQLAKLLESDVVVNHFYFGSYADMESAKPGTDVLANAQVCGTTACALGWAPALPFAKKLGYRLLSLGCGGYATFAKNGRGFNPNSVSRSLFGLTRKQSDMLFQPGMSPLNGDLQADASPVEVAKNIRDFVAIRFG